MPRSEFVIADDADFTAFAQANAGGIGSTVRSWFGSRISDYFKSGELLADVRFWRRHGNGHSLFMSSSGRWLLPTLATIMLACSAFGQAFTFSDVPFLSQGGTDWQTRVIANGGAPPSANTVAAMETLRISLEAQGLTNKIYSLCIFVPDSVIAASTPLVKWKGSDPWTNNGFVSGDLNINGLKPHASTNFLDTSIIVQTGVTTNHIVGTNLGLSVVITESITNAAVPVIQNQVFLPGNWAFGLHPSGGGSSQVYVGEVQAGMIINTNDFLRVGYYSGNRYTTNMALYVASPIENHKMLSSNSPMAGTFASKDASTFAFFQARTQGTNVANGAGPFRLSMACIHDGFTQVESSNFWWAVKTCRESLGGGTGEPIHDYNVRLGDNAVSVNTSNALRTFRQGLDTDDLLYKMIVANALVPDNLTAARQPVVVQAGLLIWTNNLFAASNLTVNGLTGDFASKYLGTGLNPAGITYGGFGSANGGITILIFAETANACFTLAGGGTSANSFFSVDDAIVVGAGLGVRFCSWKTVNVNTNFLVRAKPAAGTGYSSGNRTASNSVALYWATNGVHNVATNSTVLETSGTPTITNMYAFAGYNAVGGPSGFSDKTTSYISMHAGFTQTEDSNQWRRVLTLRTNLGGGSPP